MLRGLKYYYAKYLTNSEQVNASDTGSAIVICAVNKGVLHFKYLSNGSRIFNPNDDIPGQSTGFEPSAFVPAARHTDDVNSRENMGTTKRMDTVIVKAKQLTCINKNSDIIDVRTIPQSLSCK
jgi:hypothetical protein